jgi:hypothetical protein
MNPPRDVTVSEDLGHPVKHRQGANTIFDVLKKYKDRDSNVNVFWVWSYQSNTSDIGIGTDAAERIIVISDGLPRPEQQLAKAFARLFGVTRKDIFLNDNMRLGQTDIRTINATAEKMSDVT